MKTTFFLLMLTLALFSCQKFEQTKPAGEGFIKVEIVSNMFQSATENDNLKIVLEIKTKTKTFQDVIEYVADTGVETIGFITEIPVKQDDLIYISAVAEGINYSFTRVRVSAENVIPKQYNLREPCKVLIKRDYLNLYGFWADIE